MILGDVFAEGSDVSIGEGSLAVVVGGIDCIDRMSYGAPRGAVRGTDAKGAVGTAQGIVVELGKG